ncbi:hypothetical protein JW721_01975 [Candidatus Micrarchaeota archaeon]|nr:hypothetical protein [Candidatus Micrarchaeota archaeon]
MAQKELAEKHPDTVEGPPALGKVPAKIGFLDSIDVELTHVGYANVGQVTKGEVSAAWGPIEVGLGAGAESLDYYRDPLFFVAPRLEVRGILGDFELYSCGSMVFVPKTDETRKSTTAYLTVGGVVEPLSEEKGDTLTLRVGAEFEASGEKMYKDDTWGQYLYKAGFGSSVGYRNFTIYAVEEIVSYNEKVYTVRDRLIHHKIRSGISASTKEGKVQAEFFQTPFEKGGELSFTFKAGRLVPQLYGWYSKEGDILGREHKAGSGLKIAFGSGALNVRSRVERGFELGEGKYDNTVKNWKKDYAAEKRRYFYKAVRESKSIAEFASKYLGKSTQEILSAVSMLGLKGDARTYDKDATNKDIEEIGAEGAFLALRKYIITKIEGGGGQCPNISGALQSTFLREVGWEAYSGLIAAAESGHVITVARDPKTGEAYLLDYGDITMNGRGRIWPLIRQYAQKEGVVPLGVYLFGEGNKVIGYYEAEERKLNRAMAGDRETLKEGLLHSRPKKKDN